MYHYYNRNETKLCSMYGIALLTEKKKKKLKPQRNRAQQILKTFVHNFHSVSK